jgi:hypothetical protein
MMRTPLRLAAASAAAATLVVTAAGATAEPISSASVTTTVAAGTGSSAADSGSAAARTGLYYLERGDIIGILVLMVAAPLQILTSGICDLATMSALPSPCVAGPP